MRTMYDAVTARNIPANATMVAGYIDKIKLEPWSAADWARFPSAVKVAIVKKASTNAGHVLDVEPGDATPAEAPGWVRMRRAAGADPTVYMNSSTWPVVQAEFVRQGVAHPHYWVAKYDGVANLPTLNGIAAVAKQYRGDVAPGIDINCVADFWPGVDSAPTPQPAPTPYPTVQEDEEMEPIQLPVSANQSFRTIPWNGKAGVLNAITSDQDLFIDSPSCWGPTGGVGGGEPTNPNLPHAGAGWRVTANLPGAFRIPAGTTRIFIGFSSDSITYVWPVAS